MGFDRCRTASISIMSPATEMGQGSMTSLPRIIAEELDADWDKVRVVPAPPIDDIYGNPGFGGMMYTAGSNAVRSYYDRFACWRAARRVLLENAAHWLERTSLRTHHRAKCRRACEVRSPHDLWRDRPARYCSSTGAP